MEIKYIKKDNVPTRMRQNGKYKHMIMSFLSTKNEAMSVNCDSDREAQSLVGFCKSKTGQSFGVDATQRKNVAYVWRMDKK